MSNPPRPTGPGNIPNPGDAPPAARLFAPATARNREPILAVLKRVLPRRGTVLEIASGTGEHAAFFAPALPHLVWQPSDPDAANRASIGAWREETGEDNVLPPLDIDVREAVWPVERTRPDAPITAVVCINMIHIAPWQACLGLLAGAGRILPPGGRLYLYGPFRRGGRQTAPSNEKFEGWLKSQDPEWGVRNLEDVVAEAEKAGLVLEEVVEMPANNLSVILRCT